MANQPKNLGLLHEDKTGLLKHREWRGLKDTMYDYYRWLITWKDMIVMVLKAPRVDDKRVCGIIAGWQVISRLLRG